MIYLSLFWDNFPQCCSSQETNFGKSHFLFVNKSSFSSSSQPFKKFLLLPCLISVSDFQGDLIETRRIPDSTLPKPQTRSLGVMQCLLLCQQIMSRVQNSGFLRGPILKLLANWSIGHLNAAPNRHCFALIMIPKPFDFKTIKVYLFAMAFFQNINPRPQSRVSFRSGHAC